MTGRAFAKYYVYVMFAYVVPLYGVLEGEWSFSVFDSWFTYVGVPLHIGLMISADFPCGVCGHKHFFQCKEKNRGKEDDCSCDR